MKNHKQWAEEFPILIPANIALECSRNDLFCLKELQQKEKKNKEEFLEKYHNFIKRIQNDARKQGMMDAVKIANNCIEKDKMDLIVENIIKNHDKII